MTNNEVNKIIAEFMEWETCNSGTPFIVHQQYGYESAPEFTQEPIYPCKSLDALIPVWEKLSCSIQIYHAPISGFSATSPFGLVTDAQVNSIQEAAAHATAKAILELKK